MIWEKLIIINLVMFMEYEEKKLKPIPYAIGIGDTLMVRVIGYGFCPSNCNIDHFHFGHYEDYDCKTEYCMHRTIIKK